MNSKKNQGFTLVELLVVVGILAVLGAVVFPTVQNALNKGREAAGLQNMRQLADALISYVSDTNQYPAAETILGSGGTEVRQRWFNTLAPYIGVQDARAQTNAGGAAGTQNRRGDNNQEVFNQVMIDPLVRGTWQIGENNSIGYNYQYLGNARSTGYFRDPSVPAGASGAFNLGQTLVFSVPGGGRKSNGFVNFPVQSQEIQSPDKTIAFAYSDGTGHIGPYRNAQVQYTVNPTGTEIAFNSGGGTDTLALPALPSMSGHEWTTLGNDGFLIDPTFLPLRNINPTNDTEEGAPASAIELEVAGSAAGPEFHAQATRSIVTNRYDGGTVVAYCDGHVQYLKREAVYLDPRSGRPSNRLWNGLGRDNDENANGIIDPTEAIVDQNEWAGLDATGTALTNAAINDRCNPGAVQADNGSFLQGGVDLRDATVPVIRGGDTSSVVSAIFEDIDGPTMPKVTPFPIIVNVLGDTLVNTAPTTN